MASRRTTASILGIALFAVTASLGGVAWADGYRPDGAGHDDVTAPARR